MEPSSDTLLEFEVEKNNNLFFIITTSVSLLLLIASGAYQFWLFRESLSNPFEDEEFSGLLLIQLVFPAIGIFFFLMKRKAGWYLLMLFSIMNATYIIDYIIEEHSLEIIDLFFVGHFILMFLLLTRSVTETFFISRKAASTFTIIASVTFIAFFYFLF